MAATPLSTIRTSVRNQLREPAARFWTDAELDQWTANGIKDLWGAILDLHGEHYLKVNDTDVWLRKGDGALSGVPDDCFRVWSIGPANISSSGAGRGLIFLPRKFHDPDFIQARTLDAQDPGSSGVVYFDVSGVGPPVEAPHIRIAPKLTADLQMQVAYNPTITINDMNPIPGESDNALIAWTLAYARAKELESQTPDPGWLQVYATEKQLILARLTPRQEQEDEIVDDFFQGVGGYW